MTVCICCGAGGACAGAVGAAAPACGGAEPDAVGAPCEPGAACIPKNVLLSRIVRSRMCAGPYGRKSK